MAAISEGEVAVYDRQLRLWGVQAQQRLLQSKVLIWGLEGGNVETCKNLVLAGVAVTVWDHRAVKMEDVSFDYFLREEDVGRNRAECAVERFQEMNTLTTVSAGAAKVEARDVPGLRDVLRGFDVVCVGLGVLGWDVGLARAVDAACREVSACFFLPVSAGEVAFFFSDLHEHTVQEYSSPQGAQEAVTKQREPEVMHFSSFGEWLGCPASRLEQESGPRGVDPAFVLFRIFLAFLEEDKNPLETAAALRFQGFCEKNLKVPLRVPGTESGLADLYGIFLVEPLVHVASVLGGLLTQEVIKAITKRDVPLQNSVVFNGHVGAALVEQLPLREKGAPKKRKLEEVAQECEEL